MIWKPHLYHSAQQGVKATAKRRTWQERKQHADTLCSVFCLLSLRLTESVNRITCQNRFWPHTPFKVEHIRKEIKCTFPFNFPSFLRQLAHFLKSLKKGLRKAKPNQSKSTRAYRDCPWMQTPHTPGPALQKLTHARWLQLWLKPILPLYLCSPVDSSLSPPLLC